MAGGPADQLHRLLNIGTAGTASDGELLDRFVAGRDEVAEAAFEELVSRHGPLVLRVCRSVLHDAHDAEDAFQAVFLVLANRAGSVRDRGSVASWLFGVAHRVAMRGKRRAARKRAIDRLVAERTPEGYLAAVEDPDWEVLHEEIAALPERLRAPVVLCGLQGLTYDAAAMRLGASAVAVRGRLARAREKLKRRLTHRGVTASAGFLVAGAVRPAEAAVPLSLVHSTLRIAQGFLAGGEAAVLARGVLNSMFLNQLKIAAVLLCLGAWGGHRLWSAGAAEEPARKLTQASKPKQPESPPPAAYRLTGSVRVEGTGEPVPGARITVMLEEAVERRPDRLREVTSGADGRFAFNLEPGQARLWMFRPPVGYWSPGGNMTSQEAFVLTRSHPVHQRDYVVRRGTVWSFGFLGTDGKPLKGGVSAQSQHGFVSAEADRAGRFPLTLPAEAGEAAVVVVQNAIPPTPNTKPIMTPLKWAAGFRPDFVRKVERVENAYRLTDDHDRTATISDAPQTLPDGSDGPLLLGGGGRVEPSLVDGKLVVRCVFSEAEPVALGAAVGRVVDGDGRPIEGVRVGLRVHIESASGLSSSLGLLLHNELQEKTDRDGRFRINGLTNKNGSDKSRGYSLALWKKGLASLDSPKFTFQPGPGDSPHELAPIHMEPGVSLSGIVVDPDGKPVESAWVRPIDGFAIGQLFTKTDASGEFVLDDLPKSFVNLQVQYGSLAARAGAVASDDDEGLKIQLRPESDSANQPFQVAPPALGSPAPPS
ncbi:MAG: sigma-70 family RNA polymerase sigma factor [Paludisphaera borealis]|uniref:sigma-70 family RNA polymerase sigma factor n=1 Tax=Paludisphaera borealis TaxID=1387353 RepID=UPI002848D89E|nr:sigma-70 family RNA polymerase sigma factor [Paludisphaera borealis]MDR3620524.1 sigma-70 family RNA polymerase sigma factor [Paludisphaera borealis]